MPSGGGRSMFSSKEPVDTRRQTPRALPYVEQHDHNNPKDGSGKANQRDSSKTRRKPNRLFDALITHWRCLCIGGACALLAAGKSELVIKRMGRWSGWCFTVYTRLRSGMLRNVSEHMINAATWDNIGLQGGAGNQAALTNQMTAPRCRD
ncbi:hypothetical protein DVH05_015230 [Phytophthora capsici]|nr:hypothetical protein DVH05_015230 [Phytophthora capsici]